MGSFGFKQACSCIDYHQLAAFLHEEKQRDYGTMLLEQDTTGMRWSPLQDFIVINH